jgi:hypothetical protein
MRETILNNILQTNEVIALSKADPQEYYYEFKNINNSEERLFAVKAISKSSTYSYLLVYNYGLSITDKERHMLLDSVLDDPNQSFKWLTTIRSNTFEKELLAKAMIQNPKIVADMLYQYHVIPKEIKDILLDCIYKNPIYGDKVYARATLTEEEYDKLVKSMASNDISLLKLLEEYCILGEFAREFTKEHLKFMVEKTIEFNNMESAYFLKDFDISEEEKNKLVPLLVARRLMQNK